MARDKDIVEGILLEDATQTYTLVELSRICVTDQKMIIEMVEYGIIEAVEPHSKDPMFSGSMISRSQKAIRLHRDLSINWPGISLALDLLEEIETLRAELQKIKSD